jgi:phosphatidylglycerol:prolipoprotein diacylglycerol transferase
MVSALSSSENKRRPPWTAVREQPGSLAEVRAERLRGGAVHPILFHLPLPGLGDTPIYSYGVMLGISFVVGWYLTLGLADRHGLERETMANCYVVTALSALVASRLLYVVTNLAEFHSWTEVFALRRGGLAAYGGFLGGFAGSWLFLRRKAIPFVSWADVAVPSLASGLLVTRLGCYLYGCDFGSALPAGAPRWLVALGTFPRWSAPPLEGTGSPAWAQHVRAELLAPGAEASLPVHPTQLYEAAVGMVLLVVLLLVLHRRRFAGEVFLTATVLYGFARFALEILRDDVERGAVPPSLPRHVYLPVGFFLLGLAFGVGPASRITGHAARAVIRIVAFAPAISTALAYWPGAFEPSTLVRLSTSQAIGLGTALAAALTYRMLLAGSASSLRSPTDAAAPPAAPPEAS